MKTRKSKYLEIENAEHLDGHRLRLEFNDGVRRVVDFGPFLKQARHPQIAAYRSLRKFKSFHIEHGQLMWGDYEMLFPVWDLHEGQI